MRNLMLKDVAGLIILMLSFFFISISCQGQGRERFIKIILPNGNMVTAELAVTDAERARGLMFRKSLLPEEGMLFVFDREDYYGFWMKNTLISLDIIWLDKNKIIVHIEKNVPPCSKDPCPSYEPNFPSSYVLELQAGSVERIGLKLGDRLDWVLPKWIKKESSS